MSARVCANSSGGGSGGSGGSGNKFILNVQERCSSGGHCRLNQDAAAAEIHFLHPLPSAASSPSSSSPSGRFWLANLFRTFGANRLGTVIAHTLDGKRKQEIKENRKKKDVVEFPTFEYIGQ